MKYSLEHLNFLKKKQSERILIIFIQIILIIGFFIIWELLAHFSIINTFLYSSPSRIINTLVNIEYQELLNHFFITIYEVIISFIISVFLGIIIASLLWARPIISKVVDPFITIINSLPKVALGPLFIIWIGTSINSIIFMSLTISLFTTIINIYQGFNSVDSNYVIMLKSFRASKWQIYKKIIIPCSITNIISTLKVNISLSLIGVIMGELLVSKRGLGYLIMYGSQVFQLDLVISSVFLLGIISYLLYFIINRIEIRIISKYKEKN